MKPNNCARMPLSFNFVKCLESKHNDYVTARKQDVANCWFLNRFAQNKVKHSSIFVKNRTVPRNVWMVSVISQ